METFHDFHGKLYKAGNKDNEPHMNLFLDSLPLPKLETRHRDELKATIIFFFILKCFIVK